MLLDLASKPGHQVTITHEGHLPVIMMSQEDFEGWVETLEIMSDPQLMKDLRNYEKQKKAGTLKTIPWEKVKKKLRL